MSEPRRFPYVLTLAVLVCLAILCGLGTWQLQRMDWKRKLIANVQTARTAPALRLGDAASVEGLEFRRAIVDCPVEALNRRIELYALVDGVPGRRLVAACPLPAGGSILVDLGFVAETISTRPQALEPATLTGVLRAPDNGMMQPTPPSNGLWYGRDVPAMAKVLDAAGPASLFLFADRSAFPAWQALKPAPLPTDIPNRHLEYALTWFGLAGALIAIYAAMLWRRFKAK